MASDATKDDYMTDEEWFNSPERAQYILNVVAMINAKNDLIIRQVDSNFVTEDTPDDKLPFVPKDYGRANTQLLII